MDAPDPPLSDGVVTLRPWRDDDVPALLELWGDPEVQRWTLQRVPFDEDAAQGYLAAARAGWRSGAMARFAITALPRDDALGAASLRFYEHGTAEVAYAVVRREWGRGLAPRAVRLLSRWALDELGIGRVELLAHPDNAPSHRVAEKAGYTREGILRQAREQRGVRFDCVSYSLVPTDPH